MSWKSGPFKFINLKTLDFLELRSLASPTPQSAPPASPSAVSSSARMALHHPQLPRPRRTAPASAHGRALGSPQAWLICRSRADRNRNIVGTRWNASLPLWSSMNDKYRRFFGCRLRLVRGEHDRLADPFS